MAEHCDPTLNYHIDLNTRWAFFLNLFFKYVVSSRIRIPSAKLRQTMLSQNQDTVCRIVVRVVKIENRASESVAVLTLGY